MLSFQSDKPKNNFPIPSNSFAKQFCKCFANNEIYQIKE